MSQASPASSVFFFNDPATTEIYTLSLHDALPICCNWRIASQSALESPGSMQTPARSEEHTSELQSPCNLVCRLLLERKTSKCPKATNSVLSLFRKVPPK